MHGAKTKITLQIMNDMCFYTREQLLCAVTNDPFLRLIAWDQDIVVSRFRRSSGSGDRQVLSEHFY